MTFHAVLCLAALITASGGLKQRVWELDLNAHIKESAGGCAARDASRSSNGSFLGIVDVHPEKNIGFSTRPAG
jgi:hypothetical protein